MANVELSNIFHFKGKLARCNGFHGMDTDNKGNRLAWGTRTSGCFCSHLTDGIPGTGGPGEPDP